MKKIALLFIRFYQNTWSRMTPSTCRFYPTCSHYGYEAIETYGFFKGGWMAIKRIGRCHPFHPGGYDPVPKPDGEHEHDHEHKPVIGNQ
jgi:putative membrane protein insertion efficiency factor